MNRRLVLAVFGSIGFANLCALNLWHDCHRLRDPSVAYFGSGPSGDALIAGTTLAVLCLAALFLAITLVASRVRRRGEYQALRLIFILAFLLPASVARSVVVASHTASGWPSWIQSMLYLPHVGIMIGAALYLRSGTERPVRILGGLNLLLSPLFLIVLADSAAWIYWRRPAPQAFLEPTPAAWAGEAPASGARVLWLIFDEMDYAAAFSHRPAGLQLTELDRLRSESLSATDAYAPSDTTLVSMPALINGTPYVRGVIEGVSTLRLHAVDAGTELWEGEGTVFAAARGVGAASAVAGWFHPYCRLFGGALSACAFAPETNTPVLVREAYTARIGPVATAWYLLRGQSRFLPLVRGGVVPDPLVLARTQQLNRLRALHASGLAYAADPRLSLILLHYPLPHPYGIYDRKTARFSTSASSTYVDNLALVDRVIGELRQALEQSGLWESTAIILSSDHSLRKWDSSVIGWTPAGGSPAPDGKQRIPFLVKLPGQAQPRVFTDRLNTIVTRALVLGILEGTLTNAQQLEQWLYSSRASSASAAR